MCGQFEAAAKEFVLSSTDRIKRLAAPGTASLSRFLFGGAMHSKNTSKGKFALE